VRSTWCRWNTTDFTFGENPYKWSQRCIGLVLEALKHSGGPEPDKNLGDWLQKHPDKKKRLINLLCQIDGKKYDQKKYVNEEAKITVKDVKILAHHILGESVFTVDGEASAGKKKDITVTVTF